MHSYPLVALDKSGTHLVPFDILDGPIQIDAENFILQARPGSPILSYSTILRGMDVPGLYEGSIVEYRNEQYVLHYWSGFRLVSRDDKKVAIEDFDIREVKPLSHIYFDDKDYEIGGLKNQKFKYCGNIFTIKDILGCNNGLILKINGGMIADLDKVQQYAGCQHKGRVLYYGDSVYGGILVMHEGRICVLKNKEFVALDDYVKKESKEYD